MRKFNFFVLIISLAFLRILPCLPASAGEVIDRRIIQSRGQKVYVPIYSQIFIGHKGAPYDLTVTLSVRNADPDTPIRIISADYYNSQGELIKKYLKKEITIQPISANKLIIPQTEKSRSFGSSVIVTWKADKRVIVPLIETIMIGTKSQQGISFLSRGRILKEF